ncbi:MAG TPA: NADH-quinone oxidoreductase subunit N [Trueperaceae bacterium]|nr:NADH-quinone oxidoreductase subunit N [Trueperaceae bacterium]
MTFPPVLDVDWGHLAPALTLLTTAAACLLLALFQRDSRLTAGTALIGLFTAFVFNLSVFMSDSAGGASFGLRYLADAPALAFNFVVILGTALAVLVSYDQLSRMGMDHPEYYPLMLLSALGAVVMAAAGDLVTLLLGLEVLSLPVYVLSAWRTSARQSEEAGMKYFLLGAFGSAVLVYGAALLYGASGSFVYAEVVAALTSGGLVSLATAGAALVLVGLGFKAALAPFHQWSPDVYTGAPTPVVTFMSVVVKAAAFAALLRVAATVAPEVSPWLQTALAVAVAATLVVGNLAALVQRGVKRMLAYSAVAHAGYLGLAVLAPDHGGVEAAVWYLTAYTLMNAGAFAVLSLVVDKNDQGDDIERFAGLGQTRPGLALALTVFLLSLGGIPPLAGFAGKVMVFSAAVEAGYLWLALLGIATSVVALVYYFRVVAAMYFRRPEYASPSFRSSATDVAIAAALAGTVLLGILPGWWHDAIRGAQAALGF